MLLCDIRRFILGHNVSFYLFLSFVNMLFFFLDLILSELLFVPSFRLGNADYLEKRRGWFI